MNAQKSDIQKYIAEMIGTMVLVLMGCGVAVLLSNSGADTGSFVVGTALAFGLSIVAMAYTIGDISGCHINPAVSLAMWINKKMSTKNFIGYVIFQFIGGIIGAAILFVIVSTTSLNVDLAGLGCNGFDNASSLGVTMAGAIVVEIVLTFIFVLTILGVTAKQKTAAQAGLVIGLTLTFVHLFGILITGTSVNPARSFGPALMMLTSTSLPMEQVWVFIVAPLIGAAIAAFLWKYVLADKEESAN